MHKLVVDIAELNDNNSVFVEDGLYLFLIHKNDENLFYELKTNRDELMKKFGKFIVA